MGGMDKVLASMDMNKISQVMDKFEASFEEVDMRSACLEGAMDSATSASMPEEEVDSLLAQVSDEHGLAFRAAAADASRAPVMVAQQSDQADGEDALEKRLAALRAEG